MFRRFFWCGLFLLWPVWAMAQPPRLTGISPGAAGPGHTVIVTGGPFTPEVIVMLGDRLLTPSRIGEKQLSFVVPQLPTGDYLLQLQAGEETSDRSLFFRLVLPPPSIQSLDPQRIDRCDLSRGRQVTVRGRDLQPGTLLLLNGAILAAGRPGPDAFSFSVPELAPGLHQVQLVNPDGRKSVPAALVINSTPEIESVVTGEESVTFYKLVISGKNFTYKSALLVDGRQITSFYPGDSLNVDGREVIPFNLNQRAKDTLQYVDCHTLVYVRHPYTTQPKTMTLQVVNPDGKESGVYSYTGP